MVGGRVRREEGGEVEGRVAGRGAVGTYHQDGCLPQGTAAVKYHSKSARALLQPAPALLPPHLVRTPAALGQPDEFGVGVGVGLLAGGREPGALHGLLWG